MNAKNILTIPSPAASGAVSFNLTGMRQFRIAAIDTTFTGDGVTNDSRVVVQLNVKGVRVMFINGPATLVNSQGFVQFGVGLSTFQAQYDALTHYQAVALPSITWDGGDEDINALLSVSHSGGGTETLAVSSVTLDRVLMLRGKGGRAREHAR